MDLNGKEISVNKSQINVLLQCRVGLSLQTLKIPDNKKTPVKIELLIAASAIDDFSSSLEKLRNIRAQKQNLR